LIINPSEERIDNPCGRIPKTANAALSELLAKAKEGAMQQTTNETSNNPLEDLWEVILRPYEDHPHMALTLAQNFQAITEMLGTGPSGAVQVAHSMEEAIETLFPYSEIYKAGREFYLLAVKGTLTPAFDLTKLAEQARLDSES
jgi:hypothetical protein